MLKRKEFNRKAKQLLADDDLRGLVALSVALVTERPVSKGHWTEELQQTLATAATEAAHAWWTKGGNCHKKVCAAISNAAREFRGQGGYRADNTWRGGYSTDKRKFSSQLPETLAGLAGAIEDAAEAPESTETDERDQRDSTRERLTEFTREHALERTGERHADKTGEGPEARIFSGGAMLDAGAERNTGIHADDLRLDSKDDGEAGYGVDGATRGLNTGRVLMKAYDIAWQTAAEEVLTDSERHFLTELTKAGTFRRYVDAGRKHKESAYIILMEDIRRRLAGRIRELLAGGREELQAAWVASAQGTDGARYVRGARVAASEGPLIQGRRLVDLNSYAPPAPPAWRVARDEMERTVRAGIAAEQKLVAEWLATARTVKVPKHNNRDRWPSREWYETDERRQWVRTWLAGVERYRGAGRLFRLRRARRSLLDEV